MARIQAYGDVYTSLVNANNALFHSGSHIYQMLPQIIPILRFCPVES